MLGNQVWTRPGTWPKTLCVAVPAKRKKQTWGKRLLTETCFSSVRWVAILGRSGFYVLFYPSIGNTSTQISHLVVEMFADGVIFAESKVVFVLASMTYRRRWMTKSTTHQTYFKHFLSKTLGIKAQSGPSSSFFWLSSLLWVFFDAFFDAFFFDGNACHLYANFWARACLSYRNLMFFKQLQRVLGTTKLICHGPKPKFNVHSTTTDVR